MKEINDLNAEVSDLKDSLQLTENVREKKVEKIETELDKLKSKKSGPTRQTQTTFNINKSK